MALVYVTRRYDYERKMEVKTKGENNTARSRTDERLEVACVSVHSALCTKPVAVAVGRLGI